MLPRLRTMPPPLLFFRLARMFRMNIPNPPPNRGRSRAMSTCEVYVFLGGSFKPRKGFQKTSLLQPGATAPLLFPLTAPRNPLNRSAGEEWEPSQVLAALQTPPKGVGGLKSPSCGPCWAEMAVETWVGLISVAGSSPQCSTFGMAVEGPKSLIFFVTKSPLEADGSLKPTQNRANEFGELCMHCPRTPNPWLQSWRERKQNKKPPQIAENAQRGRTT